MDNPVPGRDALEVELPDDEATVALGRQLAEAVQGSSLIIYLRGDLGAGKTTLSRGIIRYFGHSGAVKSPTYTLVEPYELDKKSIFHFDLYRMAVADELSYLGLEDYFTTPNSLWLVEWPEKGAGVLPDPDISLELQYTGDTLAGRRARLTAESAEGRNCLAVLASMLPDSKFH